MNEHMWKLREMMMANHFFKIALECEPFIYSQMASPSSPISHKDTYHTESDGGSRNLSKSGDVLREMDRWMDILVSSVVL